MDLLTWEASQVCHQLKHLLLPSAVLPRTRGSIPWPAREPRARARNPHTIQQALLNHTQLKPPALRDST